jgi:hypothetical protein
MKKILALAAVILSAGVSQAQAQHVDVNCAALKGSPLMCVKNSSPFPVVAIQATSNQGFNPNSWINIPGVPSIQVAPAL